MYSQEQYEHWLSFQKGEEKGFTYFFKAFYPSFCQFANQLIKDPAESESLVSEAILTVWKHRHKLNTPTDFKRYCYTTIRHNCFHWLEQNNKRSAFQSDLAHLANEFDTHVLDAMIHAELVESLYRSIRDLPPQCAKILSKLYIDGQSVKEIAQELNLSVSTIKTQKKIGLTYLRKAISSVLPFLLPFANRLF